MQSPSVESVYQPMEDFFTFILLFLSCLGVWLGWSMIDLNPSKVVERLGRRRPTSVIARRVAMVQPVPHYHHQVRPVKLLSRHRQK